MNIVLIIIGSLVIGDVVFSPELQLNDELQLNVILYLAVGAANNKWDRGWLESIWSNFMAAHIAYLVFIRLFV